MKLQALAPDSRPGVQAHDTYAERRGTWTLGAYASVRATGEYGSGAKSFGNVMGRLTWLALDAIDDRQPTSNRYLHLGANTNLQISRSGSLRYRSRPESYLAPYVIDTGEIDASKALTSDETGIYVGGTTTRALPGQTHLGDHDAGPASGGGCADLARRKPMTVTRASSG